LGLLDPGPRAALLLASSSPSAWGSASAAVCSERTLSSESVERMTIALTTSVKPMTSQQTGNAMQQT
jgi:hypothetical protein